MDDIFSNGVYRKVKPTMKLYPTPNIDYDKLYLEQKNLKIAKENAIKAKKEEAIRKDRLKQIRDNDIKTYRPLIENAKLVAINELSSKIGDYLMGEAFARIYIKALPHDKEFVNEHHNVFRTIAMRYSDYIGGYDNLYKRSMETNSPFLRKLYNVITEAKKRIVKDRNIKSSNLMSEDDIREIIQPKPTDEERNEILKKIDELGADELAELVNNKIINVVKDEKQRQKTEMEMQTVIKSEVEDSDSEEPTSTVYGETPEDGSIGDEGGKEESSTEDSTDDNKEDETKDTKESFISRKNLIRQYDPINKNMIYDKDVLHHQNFFFTIMEACYKDRIKLNVNEAWSKPKAQKLRKDANKNPLNASNIINPEKDDKEKDIRELSKSDPNVIAESVDISNINIDDIYNEAITEYALYETAYTMKLINITAHDVAEQIKYLEAQ